MESKSTDHLTPSQLSRLLILDQEGSWSGEDATAALRHQLASPFLQDLAKVPQMESELPRLEKLLAARQLSRSKTLIEYLTSPTPVLEMLVAIKGFAKCLRQEKANPLYGGPATALYFAAIAAAFFHCHVRITDLPDADILKGCQWAMQQNGTEGLHGLFHDAISALSPSSIAP